MTTETFSYQTLISTLAERMPGNTPIVLGSNLIRDLIAEVGSENAAEFLADLATHINKPVSFNISNPRGGSDTQIIAPKGWTDKQLRRYAKKMQPYLIQAFGPVEPVRP